jgi:hypothetical protein
MPREDVFIALAFCMHTESLTKIKVLPTGRQRLPKFHFVNRDATSQPRNASDELNVTVDRCTARPPSSARFSRCDTRHRGVNTVV